MKNKIVKKGYKAQNKPKDFLNKELF